MALASTAPRRGVRRLRGRYAGGAVLAVALLTLGLTGCGGGAASQSAPPPSQTPVSAPATPSVSSAPAKPLSPFEHEAPVKVAREWAAAVGHAVNHHDASMKSLGHLVTDQGRAVTAQGYADDLQHHYTWPGPQPFTPVHVTQSGSNATIVACALMGGWSLDKSGTRVHKRKVSPIQIRLVKSDRSWQVDGVYTSDADCGGVPIKEVTW